MIETTDMFVIAHWGMQASIASWTWQSAIQVIKIIKYLHSTIVSNASFYPQEAETNVITVDNAWKDVA